MSITESSLQAELEQTRQQAAALQAKVAALEIAAKIDTAIKGVIPDYSPEDVEKAMEVLRRFSAASTEKTAPKTQPPPPQPVQVTGESVAIRDGGGKEISSLFPQQSLTGMTILESAMQILSEHGGGPMGYQELAKIALDRGYESGRKGSSPKKVRTSFSQTLRRIASKPNGKIEKAGDGHVKLLAKKIPEGALTPSGS